MVSKVFYHKLEFFLSGVNGFVIKIDTEMQKKELGEGENFLYFLE
jgi:hypothetical protein